MVFNGTTRETVRRTRSLANWHVAGDNQERPSVNSVAGVDTWCSCEDASMRCRLPFARLVLILSVAMTGLVCPVAAEDDPDAGYTVRLFVAKSDGTESKPLISDPLITSQGSPSWSRDGRLIAFDGWRKGQTGSSSMIFVVKSDGSELRELIQGAMPSLSPQGHRIAFSRYSQGRGIWIMSSEGPDAGLVQLDESGWGTDWSPDGTRIAFTKHEGGQANLVVFSLVEGTRTSLFSGNAERFRQIYWNFAWSPDSRSIAFKGVREDGKPVVSVVNADGASKGLKTVVTSDTLPALSYFPDGRLLFSRPCAERSNLPQLFTVDPSRDEMPVLLSNLPAGHSCQDSAPSPSGEFLAYIRKKPEPAK